MKQVTQLLKLNYTHTSYCTVFEADMLFTKTSLSIIPRSSVTEVLKYGRCLNCFLPLAFCKQQAKTITSEQRELTSRTCAK